MSALTEFSLSMQAAELRAELKLRRETYPRLVSRGHMRAPEAEIKIACMDAALATIMRLMAAEAAALEHGRAS